MTLLLLWALGTGLLIGIFGVRLSKGRHFKFFVLGVLVLWFVASFWVAVVLAYPPGNVRWLDYIDVLAVLALPALMFIVGPGLLVRRAARGVVVVSASLGASILSGFATLGLMMFLECHAYGLCH